MNRRNCNSFVTSTALLCLVSVAAHAQSAGQLVGTWQLISNTNIAADGTKSEPYTAKPLGLSVYTADGHYTQILVQPGISKIAANNRLQGTADENKAIVQGTIANFGAYTVNGKELDLKVEGSTYPNWIDTDQKWNVTIDGDTATFDLAATVGGKTQSTWKRIK